MQPFQPPPGWSPVAVIFGMIEAVFGIVWRLPASTIIAFVVIAMLSGSLSIINARKTSGRRWR